MAYSRRAVAQRVGRERARLCCVHALSAGTAACLMRDSCSIEAPSCEPPSVGNSRPGGGRVTSFPPPNQATRCQTTCLEIMTKHFPLFILSRSPSYIVPSKATPKGSPPPPPSWNSPPPKRKDPKPTTSRWRRRFPLATPNKRGVLPGPAGAASWTCHGPGIWSNRRHRLLASRPLSPCESCSRVTQLSFDCFGPFSSCLHPMCLPWCRQ